MNPLTPPSPPIPSTPGLPRASLIIWLITALLATLLIWAKFARLDEVTTGNGKIIPSAKEQIVQSLEGGILTQLHVKEGDIVEGGQALAQLDRIRTESAVEEIQSRLNAALATAARLSAEVNNTPLVFPPEVQTDKKLVTSETRLYHSRRENLSSAISGIQKTLELVHRELALTEPLVKRGAASNVEVLRLKRQASELEAKANDIRTQYLVRAREELAKANAEIDVQRSVARARSDVLSHLTLKSPLRGIVKHVEITTVGGVIPPNGKLMEIVPIDEKPLIEARISPRDIAFIHPGQKALVKISAYDYSIYGGLEGNVILISPDTLQDNVQRDLYYYRVYIRTDKDHLTNQHGEHFAITPGMITTVDIRTGQKTVLDYLFKPFNKAQEALRER